MRKKLIPVQREIDSATDNTESDGQWLDLSELSDVEVTSEDPQHEIESALLLGRAGGWRAADPGRQIIRIVFRSPQSLHRIRLEFRESALERTQEFVLRAYGKAEGATREIVRQQWSFSPNGSTCEVEDYAVTLADIDALELAITPDISGGGARAGLEQWRLSNARTITVAEQSVGGG